MMRRRYVLWMVLLLLGLAVLAGAAALLALSGGDAAAGLRALNERLGADAKLTWQDAERSLGGELRVTGVGVQLAGFDEPLRIDELRFSSAGDGGLQALLERLAAGTMLESVHLRAQGVRLPLGGALLRAVERRVRLWGTPLDGLGCGANHWLHAAVLRADGRTTLAAGVDLNLRVRAPSRQAILRAELSLAGVAETAMDVYLDLASLRIRETLQRTLAELRPTLASLRLRFTDQGFNAERNRFCAQRQGTDVVGFLDRHMQAVRRLYAQRKGIAALPADAFDRYREYADTGGELLIDAAPSARMPLPELLRLNRTTLLDDLRLRLSINGRRLGASPHAWLPPLPVVPLQDRR